MSDNSGTIPGAVAKISQSLLNTLPPAFIILLLLNLCFGGFIVWFLETQMAQRDEMAQQLFNRCMEIALPAHSTP
jgi:hypothetical protein